MSGQRKSPTTIQYDEHDQDLFAKKTSLVSSATIYAVVNAGSGGTSSTDDSAFTVGTDAGTPFMGIYESTPDSVDDNDVGVVGMTQNRWLKTSQQSAATIFAVVNTSAAGQASVVVESLLSAATLYAVVNTSAAGQSSVVIDNSVNSIGFATVHQGDDPWTVDGTVNAAQSGTWNINTVTAVTDVTNPIALKGNVTLSDSKTFVGLVSVSGFTTPLPVDATGQGDVPITLAGETVGLAAGDNNIGNVDIVTAPTLTVDATGQGDVPITLAGESVVLGAGVAQVGFATVENASAWPDPKTYIGLVTVDIGDNNTVSATFGGSVTVGNLVSAATIFAVVNTSAAGQSSVAIDGNVTLSDSKGFIGLVSVSGFTTPLSVNLNATTPDLMLGTDFSNVFGTGSMFETSTLADDLANTTDVINVRPLTYWFDGTTWDRARGDSTDGLLVNLGANNDITINSSVTVGNLVSAATIFAVVNTSAAGQSSVAIDGNVTLSDSKTFIGLVSVSGFTTPLPVDATGQGDVPITLGGEAVVLGSGVANIGFATVTLGEGTAAIGKLAANTGVDIGDVDVLSLPDVDINDISKGTQTNDVKVTLDSEAVVLGAGVAGIGFATVKIAANDGVDIGNVDAIQSGTWTVQPGNTANTTPWLVSAIGNVTLTGNVTLSDARTYIGLVTARPVGLTTVVQTGNTTVWTRNAGTAKTLISRPVGLGNNSLATVAVPTNAQRIKVTSLILNSNVTTEIALKSGVTYLTGNASLGVTLFPGGGFVLPGAPDSPQWISLPSGALVVEKRDPGGTVSKIGGHAIYFDET